MPHILLVDDDELFRNMLRKTLEKMGHTVSAAHSVEVALGLSMSGQKPPDLLMTDIIMPGEQGLTIIAAFKRMHPGVKIIAMSGAGRISQTNYLKMAEAQGADGVLMKPFPNEEMTALLRRFLGQVTKAESESTQTS